MVKKKGKSKRISMKDKYKIQKRVVETHRKRRKQAKRDAKEGKVIHKTKDPGIPNSWPFKQDLLKEIQRTRERAQQQKAEAKEQKKRELHNLKQHQEQGGTARTVEELYQKAQDSNKDFVSKQHMSTETSTASASTTTTLDGQSSRRAYLRELKKVVDACDVLLQVLDARDPIGSRIHPSVENAILSHADKRMVLVLNKIDLVPKSVLQQWLTALRKSRPTIAIKASTHLDKTSSGGSSSSSADNANTPVGMEGLLQLLKNYARTSDNSKTKTSIVVGVIGYPNVGKSSIINALKRSRAVGVSSRPGFTTCMQQVVLDKHVRLVDSPGVVFHDGNALLGNCISDDALRDPTQAIEALLKRCKTESLMMTYNIPAFPPDNANVFLAMVAKSLGRVLKGGIPDKLGAARTVVRDWNSGRIPYYTLPPPPPTTNQDANNKDALVVSQFGQEFDLNKLDEKVLNSLKETDEMDYVQLKVCQVQDNDDDDNNEDAVSFWMNDEEMHDIADDTTMVVNNSRAAAAADSDSDYDFDQM